MLQRQLRPCCSSCCHRHHLLQGRLLAAAGATTSWGWGSHRLWLAAGCCCGGCHRLLWVGGAAAGAASDGRRAAPQTPAPGDEVGDIVAPPPLASAAEVAAYRLDLPFSCVVRKRKGVRYGTPLTSHTAYLSTLPFNLPSKESLLEQVPSTVKN